MSRRRLALPFAVLAALALPRPSRPEAPPGRPARKADFRAEVGIDSLERRYYRPAFRFSFPVPGAPGWLWNAGLSFDHRLNGRLQGATDFWLSTGLERSLGGGWSVEAAIRHMCRHEFSRDNPVILDVNEALGLLRLRDRAFELGLGFGGYLGKTGDYRRLATASVVLPGFPAEGISLEGELKWVDFREWLYEAGFSVALGANTALFLRGARTYRFPATLYLGFRYAASGEAARPLRSFHFSAGIVPFDEDYKLSAVGEYRLEAHRRGPSRFVVDATFSSPILAGDGFFAQFRPDKLVHSVRGEYLRELGPGLFAAWYAAYAVEMPADKALPFAGSLATGLGLKNQAQFERLDRSFRYDVSAGWNFKRKAELYARAGVNARAGRGTALGMELSCRMWGKGRSPIEGKAFLDVGGTVSVRPFVGFRNGPSLSGEGPTRVFKLVVGVGLYKWL